MKTIETTTFGNGINEIELTQEQMEVVNFGQGPLLVVAGAGTGKTMCLVHRVSDLISKKLAGAAEILVLTFTDRAAGEMEERIDRLLPYAFSDVTVSTFHSFGKGILQRFCIEMGLSYNFRVLSTPQVVLFLKEHLFDLPMKKFRPSANPVYYLQSIVKCISRLKDEDISPEDYIRFSSDMKIDSEDPAQTENREIHMEMSRIYSAVTELMFENNLLDMADLVFLPLQLFKNHPLIVDEVRKDFKYILVDEFQDTNYSQYQLLKQMTAGRNNITVVGDDDQSIYRFRGAAISNILNFIDDFPRGHQIVLNRNYRSPQSILDSAYRLITHNNPYRLEIKNNINKRLQGRDGKENAVFHRVFEDQASQASAIGDIIEKKVRDGRKHCEIAVLVRSNRDADPIIRELNLMSIPFTFSGNTNLYACYEIRILLSCLRTIVRPNDSASLFYLASSEIYQLDNYTLARVAEWADRMNIPLEEAFRQFDSLEVFNSLPEPPRNIIKKIIRDLDKFRKFSSELDVGRLLYQFMVSTGYLGRISRSEIEHATVKAKNIASFFEIIRGYEEISMYPLAKFFIDYIDQMIEAGDDPPAVDYEIDEDRINILTIHKAKGLEFPIVIIPNLTEGRFPTGKRSNFPDVPEEMIKDRMIGENFHVQEERRLFYVAMTRAKEELHLFAARNSGGKRLKKVSRFLLEAVDLPAGKVVKSHKTPMDAICSFAPRKIETETDIPPSFSFLTPGKIDDYLTCPLKYSYVHIFRIPVLRHHRVVYGNALRRASLHFLKQERNKISVDSESVMDVFKNEWSLEGFLSREHEEMRFNEGIEALTKFIEEFGGKIHENFRIEKNYSFFLDNIKIQGTWDIIEKGEEGAILYYLRSSEAFDEKSANRKAGNSLINSIGCLAFWEISGNSPLFLKNIFIGSPVSGVYKPEQRDMEILREKIRFTADGISSGRFQADPEIRKCSICAYMEICPATAVEY